MPTWSLCPGRGPQNRSPRGFEVAHLPPADAVGLFPGPAMDDLGCMGVGLPREARGIVEPSGEAQPVRILSDEQSSLGLCLYALLGLGLCRSVPYVKKFSVGVIPQWYHDGGPFQVGHSHAISHDCLGFASVHCFVQPDTRPEMPILQYRREAIVALWRKAQFVPTILASRAPPLCSC